MNYKKSILAHIIQINDSIQNDLLIELRTHGEQNRGGFLSLPRQVFCYFDYLGALASNGKNSTKNAVEFMEKYLTRTNSEYKDKCNLLYFMWRHGTVHEFDAKIITSSIDNFHIKWGSNNSPEERNRKWHLKLLCSEYQADNYYWFINLFELVENLQDSLKYFIEDLENDSQYLKRVRDNYKKISKEVDLITKDQLLLKEAKLLIDATAGVIDKKLQVREEFKSKSDFDEFRKKWKSHS